MASAHQMQRGSRLDLVDAKQAKIEDYVIQKTLDGLFLMIAEQKKNHSQGSFRRRHRDGAKSIWTVRQVTVTLGYRDRI